VSKDLLQVLIEDLQKILTNKNFTSQIEATVDEKTDLYTEHIQSLLAEVQKRDEKLHCKKHPSKRN
jgi:recombination DNA repair RAD52 pathway protein